MLHGNVEIEFIACGVCANAQLVFFCYFGVEGVAIYDRNRASAATIIWILEKRSVSLEVAIFVE